VVDGNVLRVVSRLKGIELPVDGKAGRDAVGKIAQELVPRSHPGDHNQAMMELGALVCLPRQPLCGDCPLSESCVAYQRGVTGTLPVKSSKKAPKDRYFNYFFLEHEGKTWLQKRSGRDIWHSLYEFPLIETDRETPLEEVMHTAEWKTLFGERMPVITGSVKYKHKLTHQTLHASIHRVKPEIPPDLPVGFQQAAITELTSFAMPRLLVRFLEDQAKQML